MEDLHDHDARWLVDNRGEMAEALAKGVCDWYQIQYKDESSLETGEYRKEQYQSPCRAVKAL